MNRRQLLAGFAATASAGMIGPAPIQRLAPRWRNHGEARMTPLLESTGDEIGCDGFVRGSIGEVSLCLYAMTIDGVRLSPSALVRVVGHANIEDGVWKIRPGSLSSEVSEG